MKSRISAVSSGSAILCLGVLYLIGVQSVAEPAPSTRTVLVTGANRGIGLEFVRQYAGLGWRVIATCRDPAGARELNGLARESAGISVEKLDIADGASVAAAAGRHRGEPIDLLINNAALLGGRSQQQLGHLDYRLFEESFATNASGPMRVTEAFLDNIAIGSGKKILTLTSAAGSIGMLNSPANLYQYRSSKAALNLLMKNLAMDLKPRGIIVALVNPGLVDTRGLLALKPGDPVPDEFAPLMPLIRNGTVKLTTPAVSVKSMIELVDRITPEKSGVFLNYDGKELPW